VVSHSYAEEAKDGETEASTLCALVEFHSSDLPIQRFRTKLEEDFGSDITVKQAKVRFATRAHWAVCVLPFVVHALTPTPYPVLLLLVQVCIRQALGIETEVMTRRARLAEQRLVEIEEQLRQSILDRYTTVINRELMLLIAKSFILSLTCIHQLSGSSCRRACKRSRPPRRTWS
jgi:hypothetical protein